MLAYAWCAVPVLVDDKWRDVKNQLIKLFSRHEKVLVVLLLI